VDRTGLTEQITLPEMTPQSGKSMSPGGRLDPLGHDSDPELGADRQHGTAQRPGPLR
jgi:hypothetical protein